MDLSLPGMDGFEAIRQIKAAESGYWPRMVILSAFCDESEVRESALNCGCIACLQKPLDWDKLVSLLERLD